MLVAEGADAVEWDNMFNVSAGTVLLHLKGVTSFARLTLLLPESPPLGVTMETLVMSVPSALILASLLAPPVFPREGLALVTAGKELVVPVLPANLVRKMELAPPIVRIVKPVTRPMWNAVAVASKRNAAILVAASRTVALPSAESL